MSFSIGLMKDSFECMECWADSIFTAMFESRFSDWLEASASWPESACDKVTDSCDVFLVKAASLIKFDIFFFGICFRLS